MTTLPTIPDNFPLKAKIEWWGALRCFIPAYFEMMKKSDLEFRYFIGSDPFEETNEFSKPEVYIWDIQKIKWKSFRRVGKLKFYDNEGNEY